jgi:hypothetical protein
VTGADSGRGIKMDGAGLSLRMRRS